MKRVVMTAAMLLALWPRAFGGPLGLDLSLEAGGDDLLYPKDAELHVQPEVTYAVGDTGLRFGASWEIPVFPGLETGTVESWEEYELFFPGVDFTLGNNNTLPTDSGSPEGFLYVTAEHDIGDLSLGLELDAGYAPGLSLDAVASITYEWLLRPGTLEIGLEQNLPIYDQPGWGESDFTASYEVALLGFGITLEIEPTVSATGGIAVGARLLVVRSL
jgi:hypothetical protein